MTRQQLQLYVNLHRRKGGDIIFMSIFKWTQQLWGFFYTTGLIAAICYIFEAGKRAPRGKVSLVPLLFFPRGSSNGFLCLRGCLGTLLVLLLKFLGHNTSKELSDKVSEEDENDVS